MITTKRLFYANRQAKKNRQSEQASKNICMVTMVKWTNVGVHTEKKSSDGENDKVANN